MPQIATASEITPALFTMPLFANLPAGRPHERHRHGTAHSADLFSVGGLTVGTDDTLAAGEVLLGFNVSTPFVSLFLLF